MTRGFVRIGPKPAVAVEFEGQGELVLFLHGMGGNRTSWYPQLPEIGGRYLAAAWDARGYGGSDDYEGPLEFADFSEDVLKVLDHFGAAKAHIAGLSMGGRIALDFYKRHPDRVRSLILADTSAGHPSATDPVEIDKALALRKQPLLEGKTPADIAPNLVAHMAGPNVSREAMDLLMSNLCALRPAPYIKTLDAVTRYSSFPQPEEVMVPTLVINGDCDPIAKPQVAEAMARRIADHRFVLLKDTGHVSNIENPAAFNAAVLSFLDGLAVSGEAVRRAHAS